jgi:hypothetical protein
MVGTSHQTKRLFGLQETWFWWRNRKERDQLEDVSVEGITILKYILKEIGCEGVYWIDLAQHMDNWQALVETVMNLRVP